MTLLLLAACRMGGAKATDGLFDDTGAWGDSAAHDGDFADTGDSTATTPPEQENDYLRLAPAATSAYVFVANPTRNTVTRISVPSLAVVTTQVGEIPSVVATTSNYASAVTLNEGSDSVSIIDADTLAVTNVPIRQNMNSLAVSPDGAWAMAWYDPDRESSGESGAVHSFNEVSFVNLATGVHTPMAVGFDPHGVKWSDDGRRAVVVSDGSLATIDLTAERLSPTLLDIADDPTDAPPAEEVELSPGGEYAFVRQFGADDIVVADLADGLVDRVPVGAGPTDLDLTPDGATVAVVSRNARQIWTLDATNPFGDPTVIPFGAAFGSVTFTPDGTKGILYTNASLIDRYAVWDVATGEVTERSLVKPVQTLAVSPTGESMLVFHTREDADGADTSSPFYGKWAISLISMTDYRQNPMLLPAEPTGYAMSDDGRYGFFVMDGEQFLESLSFRTLLYTELRLASDPVYVGALPGTDIAWASQDHDLGRISFYDASADTLDTITGFELNSEIDH